MKLLQLIAVSILSQSSAMSPSSGAASRPQLSITIRDGNFTDLDGLEPTITWENSAFVNDINIRYGIDLSARTTNLSSLPRRIWGRASRVFADRFALSARLDMDVQCMDTIDFELDGEDEETDIKMRVSGWATAARGIGMKSGGRLTFMEFTKGFDNDGNRITINPRYYLDQRRGDVVMTYDADDTLVKVIASEDDQTVTISQKLNDENMISPTISRDGSLSLAWDRKLSDDSSVRTTLNPNRSVEVEWRDAAWTANVNFPMDQNDLTGATVHIKRDVKF